MIEESRLQYDRLMAEQDTTGSLVPNSTVIRRGINKDTPSIVSIIQEAYGQYVAAEGSEPAPMTADYQDLIQQDQVWVIERDGMIVGLLVLEDMGDHLLLENVAVAARVRGQGIGSQLLEFADAQARGLGRREIRLYTGAVMTQNRHYYPRHGYVETHRGFEDGHHRVYFTRIVEPQQLFNADDAQ